MRETLCKALVLAVLLAGSAQVARPCDATGKIPSELQGPLCGIATSVHGGDAPVNQLTVILKRSVANEVAAKTLDGKNMLLQLLGSWTRTRGVRVARVEVFYGRVHIATVKTRAFGAPSITFH